MVTHVNTVLSDWKQVAQNWICALSPAVQMQPCLPFMLTWCADFRVDAVNDLLNIPCPLHNHLHSSSFFVMCCSLVQAWIMLYVQSCCMAWPATVTCIRWKKQHEKQLTACDCELVLEAEGCTLGNPAYSLRSTSSCLLLLFLCHVQPACLFSLIPLPLFFIFFFICPFARDHLLFMVV